MSDEHAEKAWLKLPGQQRWATDREIEAFRAGRASRDAEVAELDKRLESESGRANEEHLNVMRLTEHLAAERTRADKAETSLANLEAGFKSFMRSHNQVLDENERLREVIKQVRAWNEHTDFIGLETIIATAVPVEPQGEVDTTRVRIARNGDMVLRGQGVISDRNGPFRLSLKVDGIWQPVVLNTYDWNVEWADQQTPDHENGSR